MFGTGRGKQKRLKTESEGGVVWGEELAVQDELSHGRSGLRKLKRSKVK